MTTKILAMCGVAALTSTLAAQQSSQPTTPNDKARAYGSGKTVTVSGCLMRSDPATPTESATPSTTPAPATGTGYVLTQVQHGPSGKDSPSGDRSSSAKTDGAKGHHTYLLAVSGSGVDLNAHANHKVELTGTTSMSTPASHGTSGTSASDRDHQASRPMATPLLTVTALKMLAASCS